MISRLIDAGAAGALGLAIFSTAVNWRDTPRSVSNSLGYPYGNLWAILFLAASISACVGALLRVQGKTPRAQFALGAEYIGWLTISLCCVIYAGAVLIQFGVAAAISLGVTFALALFTLGRWWILHQAIMIARRQQGEHRS